MRNGQQCETLEALLTRKIAKMDGVPEAEVTAEYIRQQREIRFYPTVHYKTLEESYGGKNYRHLVSLSRNEIAELLRRADEPLSRL